MVNDMTKAKKGFTIIEVVLVLAIAGLIFLMVFVAFPALQRNRSDTQRRQDYSDLASNVINEAGNTNGKLFVNGGKLEAKKYVNSEGADPSGEAYQTKTDGGVRMILANSGNTGDNLSVDTDAPGQVVIYFEYVTCGNDGVTPTYDKTNAVKRSFVVYGFMESGNARYCVANDY